MSQGLSGVRKAASEKKGTRGGSGVGFTIHTTISTTLFRAK